MFQWTTVDLRFIVFHSRLFCFKQKLHVSICSVTISKTYAFSEEEANQFWTTFINCMQENMRALHSENWLTDPLPVFECLFELLLLIRLFPVDISYWRRQIKLAISLSSCLHRKSTERFQHVAASCYSGQLIKWILNMARTRRRD